MRKKLSLPEALEIAEKLKKKYKFGKSTCPAWFKNTCALMGQDGSYSVAICIPSWQAITETESNELLESFEDTFISLRVVTPQPIYNFDKKPEEPKVKKRKYKKRFK
jgi:hypothetical protein